MDIRVRPKMCFVFVGTPGIFLCVCVFFLYYGDPLLAGWTIKQQGGGGSIRLCIKALGYSLFRWLVLPSIQSLDRTQLKRRRARL